MIKFMFYPDILIKSQEELEKERITKSSSDLNTVKLIEKTIKKLCRKYKGKQQDNRGCNHCPLMYTFGERWYCPAENMLCVIKKYYKEYIDEKELRKREKEKEKRMQELSDWYDKKEKEMNEDFDDEDEDNDEDEDKE